MSHIIWERADGGVTIEQIASDEALTMQRTKERLEAKYGSPAIPHVMEDHDIEPCTQDPEQDFFDAWTWQGDTLTVDMPKARFIHMALIRASRNAELAKLDVPFLRAVEDGDVRAQGQIKSLKQGLRDIPQNFSVEGCINCSTLKAAWPPSLPRPERA